MNKLTYIAAVILLTGCESYPRTEKDIEECLAEEGSSWSFCTTAYRKRDEARLRMFEWLRRQDPEATVIIDCRRTGGSKELVIKIKDLRGNECES